jgi:hypothetical protein
MNHDQRRIVRRVLLGIGVFGFFLPFAAVSCGGEQFVSYSGVELLTGIEGIDGGTESDPWIIIAFIAAVAGFGLSFSRTYGSNWAIAATSAGTVISLLVFRASVQQSVDEAAAMTGIEINYQAGFFIVIFASAAAAAMTMYNLVSVDENDAKPRNSISPDAAPQFATSTEMFIRVRREETDENPFQLCPSCFTRQHIRAKICDRCYFSLESVKGKSA